MGITWRLAILCIFLCALAMPALQAAGTALPHAQASVAVNSLGLLDLCRLPPKDLLPRRNTRCTSQSPTKRLSATRTSGGLEDQSRWRRHRAAMVRSRLSLVRSRCGCACAQIPHRERSQGPVAGGASASRRFWRSLAHHTTCTNVGE